MSSDAQNSAIYSVNFRNHLYEPFKTRAKISGTIVAQVIDGYFYARREITMETMMAPVLGEGLKMQKMPGHWVLARLGKRVLRPGGMQLTRTMLAALGIQRADDVVEFAPGMGITARLTLALKPASYIAVERDSAAATIVSGYLKGERQLCVIGSASDTGLPGQC